MALHYLMSLLRTSFHWEILTLFSKLDVYYIKIRISNKVVCEWVTIK